MAEADIIHLLPDSVANQIAAGEVIQRPASVIKELVENSVDAEAKNIDIVVKDAGKTLIQVIDDGKGMSTTDARMAFERHATSKIRCADDLFTLHTMGFRGEALPSIAAVSEIEVNTRRESDSLGTRLIIRASNVENQEPAVTAKGTNIKVKNLFYNFVARRRFLKKDNIELSHIVHEFERLALVNTDVAFRFTSNGTLLHSLPRGPLKDRISALFGKTIGENLIPINTETSLVSIDGFISLPSASRQRGQRQFLFVNGRNMQHPYFKRAILSCYDNLIAKDAQPHFFINFRVAPDRIDVNIHPQKHEIKFEDEQSIWQILTASVREALGRCHAATTLDFNNSGAPDIPVVGASTTPISLDSLTTNESDDYNPFILRADRGNDVQIQSRLDFGNMPSHRSGNTNRQSSGQNINGWQDFYKALEKNRTSNDIASATAPDNINEGEFLSLNQADTTLIQLRDKYIVTEGRDGVLLIDQHRAHVNILYDMLMNEVRGSGNISSQTLMFAETIDLDSEERVMLDSSIDLIERIGFRIGRDASGAYTLDSVPGALSETHPIKILRDILNDLAETGTDIEADMLNRTILTMARSAALRGGTPLTQQEMQHIVASLFRLLAPDYTPDGKLVIYRLTDSRLASFFQ